MKDGPAVPRADAQGHATATNVTSDDEHRPSPAPRRHRGGLPTIALALNAAALAVADGASALRAARGGAGGAASARGPADLAADHAANAAEGADTRECRHARGEVDGADTALHGRRARARGDGVPVQLARATVVGSEDAALRFYRIGELDEPAEPAADWNLDIAALDDLGLDRIAFELLIGDRGEIIACTVAAPPDLPAEIRQALESRLQQTQMRPAVRDGVRVASYRRIEIYADADNGAVEPMPLGTRLILSSALSDR